jgi:hypothetical protein
MADSTTDNDDITGFLLGKTDRLSKPQEKKLDRMLDCDKLMKIYPRQADVINMLVSKYKLLYGQDGYSLRTAINDFQSTQAVLGATIKFNRDYHVAISLANIEETRQVAKLSGNPAAMAKCDQNRILLIEKFMGDKDAPDYEGMNIPEQLYSADPKLLGVKTVEEDSKFMAELEKLKSAPKRKGANSPSDVEDVGYEEVEGG